MAATTPLRREAGLLLSGSSSRVNWGRIWNVGGLITVRNRGATSRVMRRELGRQSRAQALNQDSPKTAMAREAAEKLTDSERINTLLPRTFLKPPFTKFPRQPREFFRFTYDWLHVRFWNVAYAVAISVSSMPSWNPFKGFAWKPNRKAIVPAAKALHRAMSEALATGDRAAINRICVEELQARLVGAISSRPRGRKYSWELVKYNKTPRLRDVKIHPVHLAEGLNMMLYQAVVTIASRQRLVAYDGERQVKGSEKEVDLLENIVITTTVDKTTYRQNDWRVWGTVEETTPESWLQDKKYFQDVEEQEKLEYKKKHMAS